MKKVFEKQSEYEFRHIGDIRKKLHVHSMDIYQQLNLLIHEFNRMELHPLQKHITDVINQLKNHYRCNHRGICKVEIIVRDSLS